MSKSEYEVLSTIGRGTFGRVSKVRRRKDGLILARKEIYVDSLKREQEKRQIMEELKNMKFLNHPNIVKLYDREYVKDEGMLYIYMDYCANKDLGDWISNHLKKKIRFAESVVWSLLTQITLALYVCHNRTNPPPILDDASASEAQLAKLAYSYKDRVLHRDLKPGNILLDEDFNVKLGDFGLSKALSYTTNYFTRTYAGTPFYMSPEIIKGQPYSIKSDIWGLGCIMYEVCMLQPPFKATSHAELRRKIESGSYPPIAKQYSTKLRSVIESCLALKPDNRPTTGKLLDNETIRYVRFKLDMTEKSKELARIQDKLIVSKHQIDRTTEALAKKEQELNIRENEVIRKEYLASRNTPDIYSLKKNIGDICANSIESQLNFSLETDTSSSLATNTALREGQVYQNCLGLMQDPNVADQAKVYLDRQMIEGSIENYASEFLKENECHQDVLITDKIAEAKLTGQQGHTNVPFTNALKGHPSRVSTAAPNLRKYEHEICNEIYLDAAMEETQIHPIVVLPKSAGQRTFRPWRDDNDYNSNRLFKKFVKVFK